MPAHLAKETLTTLFALADMLPGMLYRCRNDPEWTMDYLSGGAQELTGYTLEEMIAARGVSYGTAVIVAEDQAAVWEAVQSHLARRDTWEVEYRIRRRDGEVRRVWEQGHGLFAADGDLEFLVGFIVDIEDLRHAEATLAEREAEVRRKNAEIEALSTPVLEIAEGTLVVPVIGELGEGRGLRLIEVVLSRISEYGAHTLLVDITGLAAVSSASAAALVRLARTARLLGTRMILTGVGPHVAQVLVDLATPLGDLTTSASLKNGLILALKR